MFGLNQNLNDKWTELNDLKMSHFKPLYVRPQKIGKTMYNNAGEVIFTSDMFAKDIIGFVKEDNKESTQRLV